MITLASFDEQGVIVKLRFYASTAQLWEDYERYYELRLKLSREQPRVNVMGIYGHRINREDIFPMYVIPEGNWQTWDEFHKAYVKNWKKGDKK